MHQNKIAILVRTCVLFVALVNQLLMVFGYSILPISEQQVSELCTTLFTIIAAIWTWWTDNKLNG
ncbi:MAG: phage holin [Peptococcaceae bacterium]|nr:phage holin [Peptococcaceae bacterium]MBR2008859.1 phage holin [Peptococcaceae bacterium]